MEGPVRWEDIQRYKKLGFSVIPVKPLSKVALVKWEEFQTRRATDDELGFWLTEYPDMGIAVVAGAISGIVVIDVDGEGDKDFLKKLPKTAKARTGRGWHLYFKHPKQRIKNQVKLAEGIDIRGDEGYALLPPSKHENGSIYTWEVPPEEGFADLPDDVRYMLTSPKTNGEIPLSTYETEWAKILRGVKQGQRNTQAARIFGHYLGLKRPHDEVWEIGRLWNKQNKPPMGEEELRTVFESISSAERTKSSALEDYLQVKDGEEYSFNWPAFMVTIRLVHLHETLGGVQGEVTAEAEPTGHLHWGRLILSSTSARGELVRALEKARGDIPWQQIFETVCRDTTLDFRIGDPIRPLLPSKAKKARDLIQDFLPLGETTVLYGDGGSFKSTLGLAIAVAIATGNPVPGGFRPTETTKVLYLDWESSPEEHEDRLAAILNSMGLSPKDVKDRLYYRRMVRTLADDAAFLRTQIAQLGIGFVIVDSYGPAAGAEIEKAEAATRTMNALRSFAKTTKLVITHVSKLDADKSSGARPYGCYSADTEILTRSGWRTHDKWKEGEEILCFDPVTSMFCWARPLEFFTYDHDSNMVHIHSRKTDALVTPNHRLLVQPGWDTPSKNLKRLRRDAYPKDWSFIEAGRLPKNEWFTPYGASSSDNEDVTLDVPGLPDSDEILRLIGWWVSEGSVADNAVLLAQAVGQTATRMTASLKSMSLKIHTTVSRPRSRPHEQWMNYIRIHHSRATAEWLTANCGKITRTKHLPDVTWLLSKRQRQILLEALVDGDGRRFTRGRREYYTSSPRLADDVQRLAIFAGYAATIRLDPPEKEGYAPKYTVKMNLTRRIRLVPKMVRHVPYKGKVYCFSTPTGAYLTRRNGLIAVQGNSVYVWNLARSVWEIKKSEDVKEWVEVALRHRKSNRGPLHPRTIWLKIEFIGDSLQFSWLDRPSEEATDLQNGAKWVETILSVLEGAGASLTVSQIAEAVSLLRKIEVSDNLKATVRTTLNRSRLFVKLPLKREGETLWALSTKLTPPADNENDLEENDSVLDEPGV